MNAMERDIAREALDFETLAYQAIYLYREGIMAMVVSDYIPECNFLGVPIRDSGMCDVQLLICALVANDTI